MSARLVYMGTPDFAVAPLEALIKHPFELVAVVCQPDRPSGRRMKRLAVPVKQTALAYGLPVLQPESVRTEAFHQTLKALAPDLIVTAAYGNILPKALLDLPPHGCLNVHASLLPAYRGAAPIQWSIIRGEQETGVSIMLMDEGMDTGPILAQRSLAIPDDMDAGRLSQALSDLGAALLPGVVCDWLAGRIQPQAQDEARASVIRPLTRQVGEIDWTLGDQAIHNLIRGLVPWPGAYTWCGDKRMKIHRARVTTDPAIRQLARQHKPGTICACGPAAMSVACGDGAIDLLEIQSASGKRLHCRDCAHNYRLGQTMGGPDA